MPDYFTLLRDRMTLRCRSIDRIFLQAYVPKLQTVRQVCTFLRCQRRFPIPSSAAFPIWLWLNGHLLPGATAHWEPRGLPTLS